MLVEYVGQHPETLIMKRIVYLIALGWLGMSCEGNFKDVQRSTYSEFTPSGEADDFNLKYTDSGRITSQLVSPKMLDYASVSYPFTEFPKGINVTMYDKNGARTFVRSDYAVTYKGTDIIDLQGNVRIWNESSQVMETPQLYFDQKNQWFYTDKRFTFTDPKGVSTGEGIDFSKDFKIINSQKISGKIDRVEE